MRDRLIFAAQLAFTLLVAAFLIVPAVLSMMAGVTVNYFRGIESGVTLQWVVQVWQLYSDTIFRSFLIAVAALGVTLIAGVPAAYALHLHNDPLARTIEEIITLPLAIPGLAIALALLLTYGGFSDFRRSWLYAALHGPFCAGGVWRDRYQDAGRRRGVARSFAVAAFPRCHCTKRAAGHFGRVADGGHAVARGIQPDLDAAYPIDENFAGRTGRQLRVDAARSRLRLYAGIFRDDRSAARRDANLCRTSRRTDRSAAMMLQSERSSNGHGVAVRVESCAKTFADGTQALGPVTLDVARGETLVLLGPSGCGKTTLLRIIAGLETPDVGGRVLFNQTDVTRVPIERRNVGMVFQSYALFPNMTVAENIGYGLKTRGVAAVELKARIAELVVLTGIEGLERRRIDQLSGGQRQRVALARAVAVRPSVLLLDELLTALDAALRERLRGELNRLLRTLGITTVYVTHDQGEAMVLGDRIVVMRKGAIAQIGTPRDIYFAPASRFVAEFVGAANIVEAAYEAGSLRLPGGTIAMPGVPKGQANDRVLAMIRPESIRLVAVAGAALCGLVEGVNFVGDRQKASIGGAAGKPLMVDVPNSIAIKIGDRVGLAIDPGEIRLLPGEPA
jgi:putative spermidine/putrescine transport system ATP-binding protein